MRLVRHMAIAAGLLAAAFVAGPVGSTEPPPSDRVPELEAAVRAIVNDGSYKSAQVGIAVMDIDTGHLLVASNEHAPLNPASNAKIYTAAVALATLRGDHRYETSLGGTLSGSAVQGDLVLHGHGDPSLTTRDLWGMVDELKTYGIRKVDGDVAVVQDFFDDQTTPPAFDQQPDEWSYFRAPVSAVALNENCITLTLRPSGVGGTAQASFDPPGFVDIDGSVTTADQGADHVIVMLSGKGQRMNAHLGGAVSVGSRVVRFTKRVEDPTLLAGYALKAVLEESGIKVTGDVKAGKDRPHVIVRHESAPLSQLLYELGKKSDNFYAEMVFKTLGGEEKKRPASSADAAQLVVDWLDKSGANDKGVVIKNGSGLFDANRVTTWSAVQLLRTVWRDSSLRPEFLAQLSVGGVDGTLHKRFHDPVTRRRVRAKTGTLDDVIALSGYVLAPPGKSPVAFSIIFNGVGGKQDGARHAADKLVELITRRVWKGE
jgi:D-alanyl-D-alanine carboxypeptidase/D-alanyl-D-alanine-endopeptidase (penicillin-binding protein 4)